MKTTTETTTTRREIGPYVWDRYKDGTLDVCWTSGAEHAVAIYGRWVIDPTTRTVYRYANESDAMSAADAGSGPGSDDYWVQSDTIDADTGETGYKAYRDAGRGPVVGAAANWDDLAQAVNDDMDEQGFYGNVYLEDRYQPELLTFVGLPDGPLSFERAVCPVAVDEWTV